MNTFKSPLGHLDLISSLLDQNEGQTIRTSTPSTTTIGKESERSRAGSTEESVSSIESLLSRLYKEFAEAERRESGLSTQEYLSSDNSASPMNVWQSCLSGVGTPMRQQPLMRRYSSSAYEENLPPTSLLHQITKDVQPSPRTEHKNEQKLEHRGSKAMATGVNEKRCYKTELCRRYMSSPSGACEYGSKCQFAHGVGELRLPPRHPRYKTEICHAFHTLGTCPYGRRCAFIHNETDERLAVIRRQNQLYHEFRQAHPNVTDVRVFDLIDATGYKRGIQRQNHLKQQESQKCFPQEGQCNQLTYSLNQELGSNSTTLQSMINRLRSLSLPSD
ncbi:unnamed protein product [Protopolystoma xenopodis]|uniref:C3H1-type domain-containing protein n=1 Tax=Protopolystoma xenopodis TaxID=117903 RepID=A0A3S4ZPT6_9PLAT|nr:unnamed protein product [Protopolystoma xenopodis]